MWNREVPISEFTQREAPTYIQVRVHSNPGQGVLAGVEQGGSHVRVHPEGGSYIHPCKASLTPRGRKYWQVRNREVPISEFTQREAPTYIQVRLHSHPGQGVLAGVEQEGTHLRVNPEGGSYIHLGKAPLTPRGVLAGVEQGGAPSQSSSQREAPTYIQVRLHSHLGQGVLAGVEQRGPHLRVHPEGGSYIHPGEAPLTPRAGSTGRCGTGRCPSQSSPRERVLHTSR